MPLDFTVIPPAAPPRADNESFARFRAELDLGAHWYVAALRAVSVWSLASEIVQRRRVHYLVGGDALDLLRVIERLLAVCPDRVERTERRRLLFSGEPPLRVPEIEFAAALGPLKYKAYLNYFFGVTVEEALLHVAERELEKAHRLDGTRTRDAYTRVYHSGLAELLSAFAEQRGRQVGRRLLWPEAKEFTYWLFRYRLRTQVPARMASDTRKALDYLRSLRGVGPESSPDPLRPDALDAAVSPGAASAPAVIDLSGDTRLPR